LKTRYRFAIWVRVIGYLAKSSRESKDIVLVTYDQFNQSGSANGKNCSIQSVGKTKQINFVTLRVDRSRKQRCAWTGFWIFWNRTLAASNRIRSEVFFPFVGSGLDLDFVFTNKTLLFVWLTYI